MVRAAIQRNRQQNQESNSIGIDNDIPYKISSSASSKNKNENNNNKSSSSSLCLTIIIISFMLLLFSIITPLILLITIENHRYENEFNSGSVNNNNTMKYFFDNYKNKNYNAKLKIIKFLREGKTLSPRDDDDDYNQQQRQKSPKNDININTKSKEEEKVKYYKALPANKTPCFKGSSKGHINCDVDVDFLAYWNDPQGDFDRNYLSPFATKEQNNKDKTYYITFEPDKGAWNNIRMSMECMFVLAIATGRTLVLPPPKPLYLLKDTKKNHGFADFYSLDGNIQDHVPIISMEEFIKREGLVENGGHLPIKEDIKENVILASKECVEIKKSKHFCQTAYDHLIDVGHNLELTANKCFIFDKDIYEGREISQFNLQKVQTFCNFEDKKNKREIIYFTKEKQDEQLWHFQTYHKEYRLLIHYYQLIFFTDPIMNNYVKRFVRDYLHYKDEIYCAAGKVIKSIPTTITSPMPIKSEGNAEFKKQNIKLNKNKKIINTIPKFSTIHARRGDFQYKRSKVSSDEWYKQTSDLWLNNEIIYIATDEKNKTFFNIPFEKYHNIYYLDDFFDVANLHNIDSAYYGMIDTIVASFGRVFVGTYFSTFSGFINRMRGYYGISMKSSYYVPEERKNAVHEWSNTVTYAKETPDGWVRIDGDEFVDESDF